MHARARPAGQQDSCMLARGQHPATAACNEAAQRCAARARGACVLPSNRKVTESFMTLLVWQMLVMPDCLRTSCAVNGTLINMTSAGELELASFVALPCSEKNCIFDTPRF